MVEPTRKLSAFDATLRPRARLGWPPAGLSAGDSIGFIDGPGDVLLLSHAPSRRFSRREPVHQSLILELMYPLAESRPGPLLLGRVVYRAGDERLLYQATTALGSVLLLEVRADDYLLDLELTMTSPELDVQGSGARELLGTLLVEKPR